MQDQILDLLLKEEEISWRTILYDLVRTEQMDPWDVNISLLTQKYIEVVKKMQEHDLKVSGKIILAAAILLKIKSEHLVNNDFSRFDALLNQEESLGELEDEIFDEMGNKIQRDRQKYTLIPKNPQPRSRKVSIHDLVQALQVALASKKRILEKIRPVTFNLPQRHMDIMEVIDDVYHKVIYYTNKEDQKNITFTRLLPAKPKKEDKVYTFVPLLHLENLHKVEMSQQEPFSEINISLPKGPKSKPQAK
jgi:segregation and condensation protein A